MALNEMIKLRKELAEKIISKVYSFTDKADFVAWVNGMTKAKFKALMIQCLSNIASDGDTKNTDALEIKSLLEE